jgi:hypothetical protein
MDSLERRDKYLSYLEGFDEANDKSFDELKSMSLENPAFAVRMNDYVKRKVLDDNLNFGDWTEIMSAGPPIQAVVDQNLPAFKLTELLVESSRVFYQNWLDKASGVTTPIVETIAEAKAFTANAYDTLQRTEQSAFSIAPNSLGNAKAFLQDGALVSNAFSAIAGKSVAYFGHVVVKTAKLGYKALEAGEKVAFSVVPLGSVMRNPIKAILQSTAGPAVIIGGVSTINPALGSGLIVGANYISSALTPLTDFVAANAARMGGFQVAEHLPGFLKTGALEGVGNFVKTGVVDSIEVSARASLAVLRNQAAKGLELGGLGLGAQQAGKALAEFISRQSLQGIGQSIANTFVMSRNAIARAQSFVKSVNSFKDKFMSSQFQRESDVLEAIQSKGTPHISGGKEIEVTSPSGEKMNAVEQKGALNVFDRNALLIYSNGEFSADATTDQKQAVEAIADPTLYKQIYGKDSPYNQQNPQVPLDEPKASPNGKVPENEQVQQKAPVIPQSDLEKGYETAVLAMLNTQLGVDPKYLKNAEIKIDGQTAFKLRNNSIETSKIDAKTHDMLQKAMSDPANLKGEVKISVGGQLLVHVKDGEVLAGHRLVQESVKVEVSTPSNDKYKFLSQDIRASGYEKTKQVATAAFASSTPENPVTKQDVAEVLSHDRFYNEMEVMKPEVNQQMLAQAESRAIQAQAGNSTPQVKQEASKDREPVIA